MRTGKDSGMPSPPPDDDPDAAIGEWLRMELEAWCGLDAAGPGRARVEAAAARLNAARAPQPPLECRVLFAGEPIAFTGPGRYVFITRGLAHWACPDDGIAFVLAHEMAHHDLGHTRLLTGRLGWAGFLPGFIGAAAFLALAERTLNGPEHEAAADGRALEVCLTAGYDGEACLDAFRELELLALDVGDIDVVFGPEEERGLTGGVASPLRDAAQRWLWQRLRGYPSLHERRDALRKRLRQAAAGDGTAGEG